MMKLILAKKNRMMKKKILSKRRDIHNSKVPDLMNKV